MALETLLIVGICSLFHVAALALMVLPDGVKESPTISRKELFKQLHKELKVYPSLSQKEYSKNVCDYLLEFLSMDRSAPADSIEKVDKIAVDFTKNIKKLWALKKYGRSYESVLKDVYFTGSITLPSFEKSEMEPRPPTPEPPEAMEVCPDTPKVPKAKVPRVLWHDRKPDTKYKDAAKVEKFVSDSGIPPEATILAASRTAKKLGQGEFSKIIKDILKNPHLAKEHQEKAKQSVQIRYKNSEAMATIYKLRLRTRDYQTLKTQANERGCSELYPSLKDMLRFRQSYCRPANMVFGPDFAMVPIPDILHHQMARRMDYEMIKKIVDLIALGYAIICYYKYGCDSASGYSNYMFMTIDFAREVKQHTLFLSELMIVGIRAEKEGCDPVWVWFNYFKNSPYGLCPTRIKWEAENRTTARAEMFRQENEAREAEAKPYKIPGTEATIGFHGIPSLVDGAIQVYMVEEEGDEDTRSATTNCPVCGASPTQMANPNATFTPRPRMLLYGIRPLHSKMCSTDYFIKFRVYSPFKNWQARGDENKAKKATEEIIVRQEFKDRMSLDWKVMKKGGISNNGAFADRCWENLPVFSEITRYPLHLLEKYNYLQIVMRGSEAICPDCYKKLAFEIKNEIFSDEELAWNWFNWSVHCMLEHGHQVIQALPLPPGLGSEEGSEHYNKFLKHDRQHHSPQTTLAENTKAMFLRPTYMSDPVINKHIEKMVRKDNKSKKSKPIPEGALRLLKNHCSCNHPPPVVQEEAEAEIEEPLMDLVSPTPTPELAIGVGYESEDEEVLFAPESE